MRRVYVETVEEDCNVYLVAGKAFLGILVIYNVVVVLVVISAGKKKSVGLVWCDGCFIPKVMRCSVDNCS